MREPYWHHKTVKNRLRYHVTAILASQSSRINDELRCCGAGRIGVLAESGDRGGERALQVWANGAQLAADGREMLSCIPGASPQPYAWSEDAVACVGTLLRELHAAAATFIPPPGTTHRSHLQRAIS